MFLFGAPAATSGSYPERAGAKFFNTCVAFDREGAILCKHRKMHLFDIDIPGGIRFMESDVLSAGDSLSVIGVWPQLAVSLARRNNGCVSPCTLLSHSKVQ